jgi:hypothetical protein
MSQLCPGKKVVDTVIGYDPAKESVGGGQNGLAAAYR